MLNTVNPLVDLLAVAYVVVWLAGRRVLARLLLRGRIGVRTYGLVDAAFWAALWPWLKLLGLFTPSWLWTLGFSSIFFALYAAIGLFLLPRILDAPVLTLLRRDLARRRDH